MNIFCSQNIDFHRKKLLSQVLTTANMVDEVTISPQGCTRYSYDVEVKKKIVMEAYSMPQNLRETARRFSLQTTQIRIWKRKFDKNCAPSSAHADETSAREERSKQFKKNSRFSGGGRKCALLKETIDKLKAFYDGKRNADLGVPL
jgi:transposase-like protein